MLQLVSSFRARIHQMRLPHTRQEWKRIGIYAAIAAVVFVVLGLLTYAHFFGPADTTATPQEFVVEPDTSVFEVTMQLRELGFIKSSTAFFFAYERYAKGREILEGGYTISASMDALTIGKIFASPPYLVYVSFPPGWRKEQIADLLQKKLGWSDEEKARWISVDTVPTPDSVEGVYYGDTYLIPVDQSPQIIAARLRGRFEDVTAERAALASKKGISWDTVLILASLVEREAAQDDKALVAGILWNRINEGMGLQIDATLQYITGKEGEWWPVPSPEDKKIDSLYNTYKYAGLPPHPIATPSLASIDAVLNPEQTNCLYYIHADGAIYCSSTYAGQRANVEKYLR